MLFRGGADAYFWPPWASDTTIKIFALDIQEGRPVIAGPAGASASKDTLVSGGLLQLKGCGGCRNLDHVGQWYKFPRFANSVVRQAAFLGEMPHLGRKVWH